MKKKIILMVSVLTIIMTTLTGCFAEESTEYKQTVQTDLLLSQANDQIGMPNISNFTEKKTLKEIYELRDKADLVTYTYTTALDGRKIYQFTSIGYGIPMSVQYSNPITYKGLMAKEVVDDGGRDFTWTYDTVPQAEPNGLYMPEGLSSTWVIRVNGDGSREPVYMEELIFVSQTKLPRRLCAEWSLPENYGDPQE